jgi:hypothetical protein
MREVALITVSCVLFVQMGLSEAIQRALHISLRIVSCPKCLTWWICLAYQVTHDYGIIEAVAASFVCSYCALWMALAYDALATLYNYAYKTITRGAAEDTQAPADEAGAEAGPDAVPQMQIDDDTI